MHFPHTSLIYASKAGISLILVGVLCFVVPTAWGIQQRTTTISLTLSNTYSGAVSLVSPICTLSGISYIQYNNATIRISATSNATFTLSGSMTVPSTGTVFSGGYTDIPVSFLTGQTGHTILAELMKGTEWFNTLPLSLTIDETPPSGISVERPRVLRDDTVQFVWTPTQDAMPITYRVVIATGAGFTAPLTFLTANTSYLLSAHIIPENEHIIYWYIEAVDCVGNTVASTPGLFYYNIDLAGSSGPLHPKPKDPPSHTTSPTEDTIYDDDQLPNEEIPLEDLPLLALPHEEQGFEDIPAEAEQQLLEHLAAPRWADWVPFANDQPPIYASKVLTQAQRQAAKLKKKLKNSPYPLDFFPQLAFLPQMEDLPEHYAAPYDPFNNLILLIKRLPPRFDKTELYQAVEYILHTRYLGLILLMGIFGYDIERTRLRLLYCDKIYFYRRKIGHFKKNTL